MMHRQCTRLLLLFAFTLPFLTSANAENDIDFDTEIMPILTRQGCNAGSCHGAAIGRGGFKLSLFGSGAAADHVTIVHQLQGRRVNLHDAGRSLLLLKPSEQLGHEGGLKLDEGSSQYEVVKAWIRQGAKRLQAKRLTKLVVSPKKTVVDQPGDSVNVSIKATFDNGQTIDVTQSAVLSADDPDVVKIDHDNGKLTVTRRGIHVVIARFLDRVVPIRLTVPLNDKLVGGERRWTNQIDVLINRQLDQLKLPTSPRATDRELLRRVTLDLAGRLPTIEEHQQFAANPSMPEWIDRLLASDAYAKYWALKWANILRIDSKQLQGEGAKAYHNWIEDQLRHETPMTELATMMLTSLGDSFEEGQINFLRTGTSPGDMAEHASKIFMGVRLRCANCHNHPLDHWQQDDYHGLAAIFAKVKRGRVVTVAKRGEVTHPVTGQPAAARIPGLRNLQPADDGLAQFATWLTAADNPFLAKVTVNRLWQQLMGRGLVEPVDDLRATNPATNPELLDWLADDFAKHGFRLKHTLKTICLSQAYQRSQHAVVGNESDATFFSHALARPLEAEVIADAIGDVTGLPLQYTDTDTDTDNDNDNDNDKVRAIALTNNRLPSEALDVLGRCDRTTSCVPGESSGGSLARTLHMINGPLINDRISDPKGRLAQLIARETDNHVLLQQLYQITLGQAPGNRFYWNERFAEAKLDEPRRRKEFFEDLLWSLLTSETFITNH